MDAAPTIPSAPNPVQEAAYARFAEHRQIVDVLAVTQVAKTYSLRGQKYHVDHYEAVFYEFKGGEIQVKNMGQEPFLIVDL